MNFSHLFLQTTCLIDTRLSELPIQGDASLRSVPLKRFLFENQPLFAPAMPKPFDMKFCERIYSTIDGIE